MAYSFDAGQLAGGGGVMGVAGSRSSRARRVSRQLVDEAPDELVAGELLVGVAGGAQRPWTRRRRGPTRRQRRRPCSAAPCSRSRQARSLAARGSAPSPPASAARPTRLTSSTAAGATRHSRPRPPAPLSHERRSLVTSQATDDCQMKRWPAHRASAMFRLASDSGSFCQIDTPFAPTQIESY